MTVEEFRNTLSSTTPPAVSTLLLALWHDAKGDWEKAHAIAQDVDDARGAWVHAYLHRKEGDLGNAGYWYARAGRKMPASSVTLETEWAAIAQELLAR